MCTIVLKAQDKSCQCLLMVQGKHALTEQWMYIPAVRHADGATFLSAYGSRAHLPNPVHYPAGNTLISTIVGYKYNNTQAGK